MIGSAHLDPAWMWEWGEGMEAFIATCRSALERMQETPDVVFTCSSAAHYQWIEEVDPDLFEQIRKRVAERRWEVVGGWWTQADCNLPSGEGFVRQGLLGQRYFTEKFGRPATVGYSPDAFGHNSGLPQLLSGAGLNTYIFCRPDPTELTLPAPFFRWLSPDGASVYAYRLPFHYNMYQTSVPKKVDDLLTAYRKPSALTANGKSLHTFGDEWALFYGVGNHGGGPTKKHIREIIAINNDPGKPRTWFGRLDRFFEAAQEDERRRIPEWRDDLQMDSPGCYSVHSIIKRLNRRTEYELIRAEVLEGMVACIVGNDQSRREKEQADGETGGQGDKRTGRQEDRETGRQGDKETGRWGQGGDEEREGSGKSLLLAVEDPVPFSLPTAHYSLLSTAWKNVCFNHFHDILCGVAIPEALDHAVHLYGESLAIADRITRYAVRRIARCIDTTGEGQKLVLFNAHSFELDQYVTFELWHDIDKELWELPVDLRVTDDKGNEVPVQLALTSGKIGKDRVGGTFRARLPPMGWRCWQIHYGEQSCFNDRRGLIEASRSVLENEHIRVEFSTESGAITRLLHRGSGHEIIDGKGAMPVVIEDLTDTWGHGATCFDNIIGRFDLADLRLVENGPTHGTVRVTSKWGNSRIQHDLTLYADAHALYARVRILWAEPRTMLKFMFPTTIEKPESVVESAYSFVKKQCDGTERPGGAWKGIVGEVGEEVIGLGIADTLTHGYSADGSTLALTVLRSPSYATHDPHMIDAAEDVRYIDMGEIEFRYTIRPFVDKNFRSLLSKDAAFLNAPPLISLESEHPGGSNPLRPKYQGIAISKPNVHATVLKKSENGKGWILRLFETSGNKTSLHVGLHLLNVEWSLEMREHEVKTFRIYDGSVEEVNLLEYPIGE